MIPGLLLKKGIVAIRSRRLPGASSRFFGIKVMGDVTVDAPYEMLLNRISGGVPVSSSVKGVKHGLLEKILWVHCRARADPVAEFSDRVRCHP